MEDFKAVNIKKEITKALIKNNDFLIKLVKEVSAAYIQNAEQESITDLDGMVRVFKDDRSYKDGFQDGIYALCLAVCDTLEKSSNNLRKEFSDI